VQFTRRFRISAAALAFAVLVIGTAAVASWGNDESDSARAEIAASAIPTDTATDTATPRATPADAGAPVAVDTAPVATATPTPAPAPAATAAPAPVAAASAGGVQAQVDYMIAHWTDYNTADYGIITDNDCVNFTSQSLIQRGWAMDGSWWAKGTGSSFTHSNAWVSSTAFRNYLASSGRATALTDQQRDQVKVGDVVQFDWNNSGDRDHTGVVTRIEGSGDDIVIYYAGHTDDTDYLSVDYAITVKHPGATAYYWSIP
jgi:hypothetical protein